MAKLKDLKIALVHDFMAAYGGAERVLETLCEMFPEAPIYTLLYDKEAMRGKFADREIHTSFLQKFPKFLRKRKQWLLPFLPTAPETFDLREFDLVISSSGAWSKGIVTKLNTIHIAYIHSPMRFVWDYNERYLTESRREKLKLFVWPLLTYLRVWDRQAAERPDYLIANSEYTKERIKKYYRRESEVIYPPVGNFEFHSKFKIQNSKFFLIVSRLSPYKRVDLAVEAFNKLGFPLLVIGEGPARKKLEKMAEKNIIFAGWKNDEEVRRYYQNARALIFPTLDDFGLVPAEAMNCGVPVIAFRKGGAAEIVEEAVTGEFFDAQTPEVLADAVRRFAEKEKSYDKDVIAEKAKRFGKDRFKRELMEFIIKNS